MAEDPIIAELSPEGILSYLSAEDLETLKFYGVFNEYAAGEVVLREGVEQDSLYIIVHGKLEVVIHAGESEVILGQIGRGDCIGEISIFEPGLASATVRVLEKAVLWHLDINSLQTFFEKLPTAGGQIMLGIAQLLSKRLRLANQAILENRMLPKHLSVRSGKSSAPITAEAIEAEESEKSGGLFGGLFGKKDTSSKIRTDIKL